MYPASLAFRDRLYSQHVNERETYAYIAWAMIACSSGFA